VPHGSRTLLSLYGPRSWKPLRLFGSFTADAKGEATRGGAAPIDLIDGDRPCDRLKKYRLGVRCTVREVEDVRITPEFFLDL
jgi:restriction system protein